MNILITGSNGFIGKNLVVRLKELKIYNILEFNSNNTEAELKNFILNSDLIIHLAAVNRPDNDYYFKAVNSQLTLRVCKLIEEFNLNVPIIFTSSAQCEKNTLYGISKKEAELHIKKLSFKKNISVLIYRLPGVFGKWSKPNYNSVVATFCYNIANDMPVAIHDKNKNLTLVYIDDVINEFIKKISNFPVGFNYCSIKPEYKISIIALKKQIQSFRSSFTNLEVERVGNGLIRALYATYLSFLPKSKFSYNLQSFKDDRGIFTEFIKNKEIGQFSIFTANPGSIRGEHYHHSKSEKFLVVSGAAKFEFCNIITNDKFSLIVSYEMFKVVQTIPGWSHSVTNIGSNKLVVLVWASEIFIKDKPDTIYNKG